MGTDAKVTIGAEGAEEVARAADRALRPWTSAANTAKGAVQSIGKAFTDTVQSTVSDVARGVTAFAAFDLASRIPSVINYREEVARLAVVAGASAEELRNKFAAQEAQTLSARGENEKFAQSFGRITHDYKDATDAAAALGAEALASGRALGDMAGAGKTIYEFTGSIKNAPEVLGRLRAQAEALGTIGGPDAAREQFESLGNVINRLAAQTPEQVGRITSATLALGKDLRPDQARDAQQTVIGRILGDTVKTERFLRSGGQLARGESILDKYGQVKDLPGVLAKYQATWLKRAGTEAEARRLARYHFGDIGGAAFVNADFGEAARLGGIAPSSGAKAMADQLLASDEGQRKLKQMRARGAQEDVAAKALPAVDAVLGFAAANPIAAGAGALLGPGMVKGAIGDTLGEIGRALGFGGKAVQAGATAGGEALKRAGVQAGASLQAGAAVSGSLIGKAGALAIAAYAGYEIGSWLDSKLGISDLLSGTGEHSRIAADSDEQFAKETADAKYLRENPEKDYYFTHPEASPKQYQRVLGAVMRKRSMDASEAPPMEMVGASMMGNGPLDMQSRVPTQSVGVERQWPVQVTILNNSHVPSEQLKVQNASTASGRQ